MWENTKMPPISSLILHFIKELDRNFQTLIYPVIVSLKKTMQMGMNKYTEKEDNTLLSYLMSMYEFIS